MTFYINAYDSCHTELNGYHCNNLNFISREEKTNLIPTDEGLLQYDLLATSTSLLQVLCVRSCQP